MAWQGSNRRNRLPKDWPAIRARILHRDPICANCGLNASVDVDHITPGDNHADSNLQGLCRHCHKAKSSAEGVAAQPRRTRNPEPHPGTVNHIEGEPT